MKGVSYKQTMQANNLSSLHQCAEKIPSQSRNLNLVCHFRGCSWAEQTDAAGDVGLLEFLKVLRTNRSSLSQFHHEQKINDFISISLHIKPG
jgi:hypothetical protein